MEKEDIVVNGYLNKKCKIFVIILFLLLFILSGFSYMFLLLQPGYNLFSLIPLSTTIIFAVCSLKQLKLFDMKLRKLFQYLFVVFFVVIIIISAITQYFHICKTPMLIDEFKISEIPEDELIKIKNETDLYNYFYGYNISDVNMALIETHKKDFVFVTISAHIENNYLYPVYSNSVKCMGRSFPFLFYQQKLENDSSWLMPGETKDIQFSIIIDRPIYKNNDDEFFEFVEEGLEILTFFVW